MSLAYHAPRLALAAALLAVTLRARRVVTLRPLAASLLALALLDGARALGPPRCLDVALFAAWWPAMALAVAGPLSGAWGPLVTGVAAWWAMAVARALPLHGAALAAEWWALWAVSTVGQGVAVAAWAWRARRRPGEAEAVALLLAAGSVADGAGPWLYGAGEAAARWEIGRWQSAGTWACVVVVSLWYWRRIPR